MKDIVVGSWADARAFRDVVPYAVISFVTSSQRSAPPMKRPIELVARIVIRADDAVPDDVDQHGRPLANSHPPPPPGHRQLVYFSTAQARRIVTFVNKVAPRIDTLFVHCLMGQGRSAATAIAVAKAYGLLWEQWTHDPYAPNPYIRRLLEEAFASTSTQD